MYPSIPTESGDEVAFAADLAQQGYLYYGGLCEEVAARTHVHPNTVRDELSSPLVRLRVLLIVEQKIVLPDDFIAKSMYHPELVDFFATYMSWLRMMRLRGRVLAHFVADFYNDYKAEKPEARRHMPRKLAQSTQVVPIRGRRRRAS